jgi:cellulose synthase/poly-beta-1,6-N-acetylglucosamine synthase-like glycosyltransferase
MQKSLPQGNRLLKSKQSIGEIDILVCAKNRATLLKRLLKYLASKVPYKSLIVIYASSVALKYADKAFWDGDKGLGAARNMAIRMASSKIVAMIDTDVILPKDWAQKIIRHFKDQEVAAAMGRCIYGYGCAPLQKLWEHYSLSDEAWGCQNVMFNREIVLEVGNFNDKIRGAGEDYDLCRRLVDAGFKVVVDKEVLAYHPMNLIEYAKHSV